MKWFQTIAFVAGALALAGCARAQDVAACSALAKTTIPGGHITSAKAVGAGALMEIGGFIPVPLPAPAALCQVQAVLTPTPASTIHAEVWLPLPAAWNHKLLASGNAGFGGTLGAPRLQMRVALGRGYATAGDDLGHTGEGSGGEDASWALNQPEIIKDFGWRANHLTAAFAKTMVGAYYGAAPAHAYFQGCSDGGREALMEAQRFPDDYDGVIAGAPANAWSRLMTAFAWNAAASARSPGAAIPDAKLPAIQAAVLAACDGLDGVKDGLVSDPLRCRFDPKTIACADADGPACLTADQVQTVRLILRGPTDKAGAAVYPGFPAAGAEADPSAWKLWITGKAQQGSFARAYFRDMVYNDPKWDLDRFEAGAAAKAADVSGRELNSDDPDLSAFEARGGKLILYHGWADAAISPYGTVQYYEAVKKRLGPEKASRATRLFMAPGLSHCVGGPGPNTFDMLTALETWVEKGPAPERIIAAKTSNDFAALLGMPPGTISRTRPLCAWPKQAVWTGKGSSDEAANFECRME